MKSKTAFSGKRCLLLVTAIMLSVSCLSAAMAEPNVEWPKAQTWTAYDVGASGYVQASAIANALTGLYGGKIRILPSGSPQGRLLPVLRGKATVGFVADTAWFATEGIEEFARYGWGPQNVRVIRSNPAAAALACASDAGIRVPADAKGKRIAWVPGAATINIKTEAQLAFGGLTWDDVEKVEFPTWAAAVRGIKNGLADAVTGPVSASSVMVELSVSPRGLHYCEFPSANKEGWARLQAIAPYMFPIKASGGAGLKEGEVIEANGRPYPVMLVTADLNSDLVYAITEGMDKTYSAYKDVIAPAKNWALEKSGLTPQPAPLHEGAILYLKHKGLWSEKHEAWNQQALTRLNKLLKLWSQVESEALDKGIKDKKFPEFWLKKRAEALQD